MAVKLAPSAIVLPPEQVPDIAAWDAGAGHRRSDIFPDCYEQGVYDRIGEYIQAELPPENPLAPLVQALLTYEEGVVDKQAKDPVIENPDELAVCMQAAELQIRLGIDIGSSYDWLRGRGKSSKEAIGTITDYIDETDMKRAIGLEERKNKLEEALRMLGPSDHASLDESLAAERALLTRNIGAIEARLEHLRFEWLSARMIVEALKKGVEPNKSRRQEQGAQVQGA